MRIRLVWCLVTVAYAFTAVADAPERVLWITIDSLRADHLDYMGYERDTSPWLDVFAEQCANFRLAIAPSNVTRRSVAAYMTGKFGCKLMFQDPPLYLPLAETTLSELFGNAGYHSLAWVTPPKLVKGFGFEQGFDEYHVLLPKSAPKATIDEIIDHIRVNYTPGRGKEFIYVHTMDVHLPYRPPIPYDRLYALPYGRPVVREGAIYDGRGNYAHCNLPYFAVTQDVQQIDIDFVESQYDGAIRYTDEKLPELLEVLRYDPDSDLIVITADHGEQFFEHGYWGHSHLLFPEEIHVPLLVRYPGFVPGPRQGVVSLMDLWPTFADLLGAPHRSGLAGVSLVDVLRGKPEAPRYAISEHQHPCIPAASVVGEGFLYRMNGLAHHRYPSKLWPFIEELYDLEADPACARNLAPRMLETADRFNAVLRRQNPRYAEFTTDLIRGTDADVRLGPNLLKQVPQKRLGWRVSRGAVGRFSAEALDLGIPSTQAYVKVTVPEPGHAHLLEVTYELRAGQIVFKLQDNLDDVFVRVILEFLPVHKHVFWHYANHRPTGGFLNVRSVVYPRTPETYFIAALAEPGEATVKSVQLRRAFVPETKAKFTIPVNKSATKPGLSSEERARMQALGYLDK